MGSAAYVRSTLSRKKGFKYIEHTNSWSDFSSMPPTSYFLSNGKENARKHFFFSPIEKMPKKKSQQQH